MLRNLISQAAFISRDSPTAAARFIDAAEVTFSHLVEMPGVGSTRNDLHPLLQDLRCWHVRGFTKVLIFYPFDADTLEIVRVLHGSRDLPALLQDDTESPSPLD